MDIDTIMTALLILIILMVLALTVLHCVYEYKRINKNQLYKNMNNLPEVSEAPPMPLCKPPIGEEVNNLSDSVKRILTLQDGAFVMGGSVTISNEKFKVTIEKLG